MFTNSLLIQVVNALSLVVYYHLVTLALDINSETIYFLFISITALTLLFTDFSFAITHIQKEEPISVSVGRSYSLRNILICISILISSFLWSFYKVSFDADNHIILLILAAQLTELLIPFYVFIILNLGIIGQAIKFFKFIPLIAVLLIFDIDLFMILTYTVAANIIILLFILIYLRIKFNLSGSSYLFNFKLGDLHSLKTYLNNFLPNISGLFIGMVIPVLGVSHLNKTDFNTLLLTDRFVRNFENIFQAVLQWNLKGIKDFDIKNILRHIMLLFLGCLIFLLVSPHLINLFLNTEFGQLEELYLKAYCTIAFIGPVITLIGVKYYVFCNRALEYSIIVASIGAIATLALVIPSVAAPLQLALPFGYGAALFLLLIRRTR